MCPQWSVHARHKPCHVIISKIAWGRACLYSVLQIRKLRLEKLTCKGSTQTEIQNQSNSRAHTLNCCAILPPKYLWKTQFDIFIYIYINLNKSVSLTSYLSWSQPLFFFFKPFGLASESKKFYARMIQNRIYWWTRCLQIQYKIKVIEEETMESNRPLLSHLIPLSQI